VALGPAGAVSTLFTCPLSSVGLSCRSWNVPPGTFPPQTYSVKHEVVRNNIVRVRWPRVQFSDVKFSLDIVRLKLSKSIKFLTCYLKYEGGGAFLVSVVTAAMLEVYDVEAT